MQVLVERGAGSWRRSSSNLGCCHVWAGATTAALSMRGDMRHGRNGPGMRPESAGKAPNSEDAALGCSFATRNAAYYVLA